MNEAFVQHAEDDIHGDDRRDDQPDGASERRLERERTALELGADIGWEIQRLLG